MLPAYQGYQEIELKRYFQSEYRDDWEYAMIQFVNEREVKKKRVCSKVFSQGLARSARFCWYSQALRA